jgi:hypothetical protein
MKPRFHSFEVTITVAGNSSCKNVEIWSGMAREKAGLPLFPTDEELIAAAKPLLNCH